jgi:hypothetical protein
MIQKISEEGLHLLKRSRLIANVLFTLKQIGSEFSVLGNQRLPISILTAHLNCIRTIKLSWICFEQPHLIHKLVFNSILKLETTMQKSLTTWTIVTNSISHFSPSFFNLGNLVLQLGVQNVLLHSLQALAIPLNVQRLLAEIGAWAYVRQILVRIGVSMGSAVFAVKITKPETTPPASLLSKLATE